MNLFYFLAAGFLVRRLQKAYKNTPIYPKWSSKITLAIYAIGIIAVVSMLNLNSVIAGFVGSFLLLYVLRFINNEADFKAFHFFIPAHYPLVAAGFLTNIAELAARIYNNEWEKNYNYKYENYVQLVVLAAFVWIFARWAASKKQQEELKAIGEKNVQLDMLVAQRTAEITKQKNELQETIKLLQATQAQLIQSEKLASLGELTAGIAHEIQNPLNFVNNFSEVSIELMEEMEQELNRGDKDEAMAIANDIKQNLEKISHHGKRADGIVKGMLQHSRNNSGERESTDINALADEYFRLSYHGLRAKDKSFNSGMANEFAQVAPKLNVVPQDIGRVLLNLFNNAFYAVQQKAKTAGKDYRPEVFVGTYVENNKVIIKVKDNGNGIPQTILDKIYQPFFTTKPTGEGTGLGLSLSYEIIKAHAGELKVNSEEGNFTEFIIMLPI